MQPGVFCLVHHTHPATTQFLNDAVVGNGLSNERIGPRHVAAILGCGLQGSQRRSSLLSKLL